MVLVLGVMSVAVFAPARTFAASGGGGLCVGELCFGGWFNDGDGGGGGAPSCQLTVCRIGVTLLYLINDILVPLLFGVAFIVFLYGVAKTYIFSLGDEGEVKKGHSLILWGVIGFVVMISLWGLVNIVANTFGLQNSALDSLPTSYTY
jgi:hypothetical protein